jgi:hypothetical protein
MKITGNISGWKQQSRGVSGAITATQPYGKLPVPTSSTGTVKFLLQSSHSLKKFITLPSTGTGTV